MDLWNLNYLNNYSFNRMNLHNHSTFSDGSFHPSTIIEYALNNCKINKIGISDHYFTKKLLERSLHLRNLQKYIDTIKTIAKKVGPKIKVLIGLEVDFSSRTPDILSLPYSELNQLDFILFEYVNSKPWDGFSFSDLIKVREFIEIPLGIAHCNFRDDLLTEKNSIGLIKLLSDSNIFLELCPGPRNTISTVWGSQPYYRLAEELFLLIIEEEIPIKFSVGTDTHTNISDVCKTSDAENFLQEHQLFSQLISI